MWAFAIFRNYIRKKGVFVLKLCLKWLVLFCCALMLCSCNTSSPDTLGTDMQQKIKQDYARERSDITADDVTIERYLGAYQDGAIALFVTSANEGYFQMVVEEDIAGIHFTFPDSQPLYIYYNSEFTPLKKAYESGIISKSDVEKIYDAFMTKEN